MRQRLFLGKDKAAAGYTVLKGYGGHGETAVFVYHLVACRVDGMHHHLIL